MTSVVSRWSLLRLELGVNFMLHLVLFVRGRQGSWLLVQLSSTCTSFLSSGCCVLDVSIRNVASLAYATRRIDYSNTGRVL